MNKIDKDILYTKFLLESKHHPGYDKVYYSTNEDLTSLLNSFNVKGKSILSITSSGDQAFHFYSKGAEKVDLFDSNRLTIHYYYLRTWVIKYMDCYYPNTDFSSYIKQLLEIVKPKTEEEKESLSFWKKFINRFEIDDINELFCSSSFYNLRESPEDSSALKEKISKQNPSFYQVDISEKIDTIPNKYDIVYVSNIRDWIRRRNKAWNVYSDNLYNLLNNNGIVLCSNVVTGGPTEEEKRIFEKNFEYKELDERKTLSIFSFKRPGYVYIKND